MKGHRRNLMILEINLNNLLRLKASRFRYSLFTSFCFLSVGTTSSAFLVWFTNK